MKKKKKNDFEVLYELPKGFYVESMYPYPKTSFPPNFENLQKNKCIYCGRKLYITKDKKLARCKSVKCGSKFIIRTKILLACGGSLIS